jgi:hypothetical protein
METMRRRYDQAQQLRHRLQRQGWFIYAVQTYCETVALLRDDLAAGRQASAGLREFTR